MSLIRWNKNSLLSFVDSHIINYPTPINLNYMWSFGSVAGLCLVIQILTGIFLATICKHFSFGSILGLFFSPSKRRFELQYRSPEGILERGRYVLSGNRFLPQFD